MYNYRDTLGAAEDRWDDQITTRRTRADEETPGLLKDERQFHREVLWAFRRHNITSGGHVGRLVLLGNNGCEQLITFLNGIRRVLFDGLTTEETKPGGNDHFPKDAKNCEARQGVLTGDSRKYFKTY